MRLELAYFDASSSFTRRFYEQPEHEDSGNPSAISSAPRPPRRRSPSSRVMSWAGEVVVAPSDKVNVAIVGAGGQGRTNARNLFHETGRADHRRLRCGRPDGPERVYYRGLGGRETVKAESREALRKATPNFRCAEYEDFRVMLEKEKAIDAVLCATPDHVHAVVAITAMKLGKHVYCEKPLTHNIWEVRQVAKVAKETGVATQMGNQGHSGEGLRQTCEWIWDGAIGTVREVHAWSDTGIWATTPAGRTRRRRCRPG